jgi:hypothetical protein
MTSTRYPLHPVPSTEEYRPDLLGSMAVIHGKGHAIDETGRQHELYHEEAPTEREVEISTVLYCVWDNRAPEIGNPK